MFVFVKFFFLFLSFFLSFFVDTRYIFLVYFRTTVHASGKSEDEELKFSVAVSLSFFFLSSFLYFHFCNVIIVFRDAATGFFFSFLSPRQCITCNVGENVLLSPVYNVRRVCCSVKCVKSDEFFRSEDSYSFFFFEKIYRRELVKYLVVRGSDCPREKN